MQKLQRKFSIDETIQLIEKSEGVDITTLKKIINNKHHYVQKVLVNFIKNNNFKYKDYVYKINTKNAKNKYNKIYLYSTNFSSINAYSLKLQSSFVDCLNNLELNYDNVSIYESKDSKLNLLFNTFFIHKKAEKEYVVRFNFKTINLAVQEIPEYSTENLLFTDVLILQDFNTLFCLLEKLNKEINIMQNNVDFTRKNLIRNDVLVYLTNTKTLYSFKKDSNNTYKTSKILNKDDLFNYLKSSKTKASVTSSEIEQDLYKRYS